MPNDPLPVVASAKKSVIDCYGRKVLVGGEPTPTRMELAREWRGVALEKMCLDLGIDQKSYEKWEEVLEDRDGRGYEGAYDYQIPPSVELMVEVANYLDFPITWFYESEIELMPDKYFSLISGSDFLDRDIVRLEKVSDAG